jgi:hypothetical protein
MTGVALDAQGEMPTMRTHEDGTIAERSIAMGKVTKTEASTDTHKPARPLKFFKDKEGNGWLCDKDIDFNGDLEAQGCWRCEEMAFPDGGR